MHSQNTSSNGDFSIVLELPDASSHVTERTRKAPVQTGMFQYRFSLFSFTSVFGQKGPLFRGYPAPSIVPHLVAEAIWCRSCEPLCARRRP